MTPPTAGIDGTRILPAALALPDDVETVVISDSGHILSSDAAARLSPRLAAFFSGLDAN